MIRGMEQGITHCIHQGLHHGWPIAGSPVWIQFPGQISTRQRPGQDCHRIIWIHMMWEDNKERIKESEFYWILLIFRKRRMWKKKRSRWYCDAIEDSRVWIPRGNKRTLFTSKGVAVIWHGLQMKSYRRFGAVDQGGRSVGELWMRRTGDQYPSRSSHQNHIKSVIKGNI